MKLFFATFISFDVHQGKPCADGALNP